MNRAFDVPVTRRRLLTGAAAVATALTIPFATADNADAVPESTSDSVSGYDPIQRFVQLAAGGDGVIYGRQSDGALLWYRHTGWTDGSNSWAAGAGLAIGAGFHTFATVLADQTGQLFAVGADGTIRWYRYVVSDPDTGVGSWAGGGTGPVIGSGFGAYPRVFGGYDGIIYAVDTDGGLWRYQYVAGNGSSGAGAWGNGGTGVRIGGGFKPYPILLAGTDGVITGVKQGGDLDWWRHDPSTSSWDNGGTPITIGSGWGDGNQKHVFAGENGVHYAVLIDTGKTPGNDDTLAWYQLTNASTLGGGGTPVWAQGGSAAPVGTGFTVEPTAALQGYPSSQSVKQGSSVAVAVSTTFSGVIATVNRISGAHPGSVWGPVSINAGLRPLPTGYRHTGCGWPTSVTVPVGANWSSGVYSLRLSAPSGPTHDVFFAVRPAKPVAKVAVLLPTNTYNAYNTWGGHNQYSVGEAGLQRTVTFLRPSTTTGVQPSGIISHTLYHDLLLLSWLDSATVGYDCYIDSDLDTDGSWLGDYQALIVGSHPEYWTETMRQRVNDYVDAGRHLICTGGNGFFEKISYVNGGTAALHRIVAPPTVDNRNYFTNLNPSEPESQIIGSTWNGNSYMDFDPYQVRHDHELLDGTGLSVGGNFGAVAYNGAASGWEVDSYVEGTIPGATLIAAGTNPNGGGAMLFVPRGNDGWVFGVGSISFNGALATDAAAGTILRNAINLATA